MKPTNVLLISAIISILLFSSCSFASKCLECGKKVADMYSYCPYCGEKLCNLAHKDAIIGVWKSDTESSIKTVTFYSDGSCQTENGAVTDGEWSFTDGKLRIKLEGDSAVYWDYEFSKDCLKIKLYRDKDKSSACTVWRKAAR